MIINFPRQEVDATVLFSNGEKSDVNKSIFAKRSGGENAKFFSLVSNKIS